MTGGAEQELSGSADHSMEIGPMAMFAIRLPPLLGMFCECFRGRAGSLPSVLSGFADTARRIWR